MEGQHVEVLYELKGNIPRHERVRHIAHLKHHTSSRTPEPVDRHLEIRRRLPVNARGRHTGHNHGRLLIALGPPVRYGRQDVADLRGASFLGRHPLLPRPVVEVTGDDVGVLGGPVEDEDVAAPELDHGVDGCPGLSSRSDDQPGGPGRPHVVARADVSLQAGEDGQPVRVVAIEVAGGA